MTFLKTRIVSLLLGLSLCLAVTLAAAFPAAAAPTVSVKACFVWGTGTPYANGPLFLMNRNHKVVKSGKTNARGCGTFRGVAGNSLYYFTAYSTYKYGLWHAYYYVGYTDLLRAGSSGLWYWSSEAEPTLVSGPYWLY